MPGLEDLSSDELIALVLAQKDRIDDLAAANTYLPAVGTWKMRRTAIVLEVARSRRPEFGRMRDARGGSPRQVPPRGTMSSVDMDEQVDLSGLTAIERELLRVGVMEWERSGGQAEQVARLLGFEEGAGLRADVQRLAGLISTQRLISRRDCHRALLATELAFGSETLGWARDWSADTGFADRDTITVLRSVQEKTAGIVHGAADRIAAVADDVQPAWSPISMDDDGEYWERFDQRFAFRPDFARTEPAIREPLQSVTVDLGPIFSAEGAHETAAVPAGPAVAVDRTHSGGHRG